MSSFETHVTFHETYVYKATFHQAPCFYISRQLPFLLLRLHVDQLVQPDVALLDGPHRRLGRRLPMEISERKLSIEGREDVGQLSKRGRRGGIGHVDGVIVGHRCSFAVRLGLVRDG